MAPEETRVEDAILLDGLRLLDEDGDLIRADMLAFYKSLFGKVGDWRLCEDWLF